MKDLQNLRNIGFIAHVDSGKTTLSEEILFLAEAIHRRGSVDGGNTVTDSMPEEQQRGITIKSSCVKFYWTVKE
ncbi:GTP-binding protein [Cytophagaceae bacterium DM2B3-1]|uniref:GTP-binding protein n=2 Tax=Xanthocytophaga TaxID=3078918 RepID=A0AAE3QXW6_9BACT|nr:MULTISPECIES: GTP-binding protein [Xanthocytophaga]MDJ1473514.1 GTP-binding protein [Xanthocytophaga flavus]MDJ1485246.1 GTP-binding protein [Xanthocytophaga flavus]MDJ1494677.1 GTP-binding protein [Xanthocytophaga flavus]MDJ1505133.1 GTP-binding protein [Xanthocytophaga agilis]